LRERALTVAHGDVGRQIFLDGDSAIERRIPGFIRDAETALAQHRLQLVLAQGEARMQRDEMLVGVGCDLGLVVGHWR
jgi:hypothetical protein